jgi:16S rRNA (uracil1498-N3)-methyltransferase
MALFYLENIENTILSFPAEESKHIVKSLRLKNGDSLNITDGKGNLVEAVIIDDDPKRCTIEVKERFQNRDKRPLILHIGIAPTKNSDRMEWFVEKAVEIGIEKISFLQCAHSERNKINLERMERVAIAAMKQSNTTRLPEIEIMTYSHFLKTYGNESCDKLIAWCNNDNTKQLTHYQLNSDKIILLIGPEGDFSNSEIQEALNHNFSSIKLGNRRLRTETAALYGCVIIASKTLINK